MMKNESQEASGPAFHGEPGSTGLSQLLRDTVRHRWLSIIAVTVLVTGLVGAGLMTEQPTYTAWSQVSVLPLDGNPLNGRAKTGRDVSIAMESEAEMVASPRVISAARKLASGHLSFDLSQIQTTVPRSALIIVISFTARQPKEARTGADALSRAFLQVRKARAADAHAVKLHSLSREARELRSRLTPRAGESSLAAASAEVVARRLAAAESLKGELELQDDNPGGIAVAASLPSEADGLSRALIIGTTAAAAALVSVLFAIWREYRRSPLERDGQQTIAGLPILGRVTDRRGDLLSSGAVAATQNEWQQVVLLAVSRLPGESVVGIVAVRGAGRIGNLSLERIARELTVEATPTKTTFAVASPTSFDVGKTDTHRRRYLLLVARDRGVRRWHIERDARAVASSGATPLGLVILSRDLRKGWRTVATRPSMRKNGISP